MSNGEQVLHNSEDGAATIQPRAERGTVWLSLTQIADLLGRDKSLRLRHIKAIFDEGELVPDSVVARYATTAGDGRTLRRLRRKSQRTARSRRASDVVELGRIASNLQKSRFDGGQR